MEEFNIGFGLFDNFSDEESDSKPENATVTRQNLYQPLKGGTMLHRATKSGVKSKIEAILEVYQEDFEKVKNYLVSKYQWNPKDKIWLRKTILVATSVDQCELAKDLEKNSIPDKNLQQAVFILLLNPVDGESVAVIHANEINRLEVFRMLSALMPNGFLSWNYTELTGKHETFVETAASCGRNNVIARLLELGAELEIPGHNPLQAACHSWHKDTIRWLLDEHFDDFDCTMRDECQQNPFIVLIQRKNTQLLDFVLTKMISYRQKYFGESTSEAFSYIFRREYEEWSNISCLTFVGTESIQEKVGEYVAHYQLDLSYQWESVTILTELLQRKIAVEYCYSEIRKNPKLLEMIVYRSASVLHECIRLELLDIVTEMYESHPEIKQLFETDQGFAQLQIALRNDGCHATVRFILNNHKDFLMGDFNKLKTDVIFCQCNEASFYEKNADILSEYFPELKQDLEEAMKRILGYYSRGDLQTAFINKNITFCESSIVPADPLQSLNSIRGIHGVTLLHLAVDKSDQKLFINLLDTGCDFDAVDNDGNHPVHYVQCTQMFDFLIETHPEGQSLVHRKNSAGFTVLHKACGMYGDQKTIVDLVVRIIECGADVNQLTNDGESVIHKTVSNNVLDSLLKYNVNLEVVNDEGNTAFQHHLERRNTGMAVTLFPLIHKLPSFKEHAHKCLEPLMYNNRDFFSCDYQGFLEQNPKTTKLIFDSVYNHSREDASKLFNKACGSAHNFIAGKFLEFGYDLDYNYKDENDYTAIVGLMSYMEENNMHIVRQLLRKGVDLEIRNQWGRNALLCLVGGFHSAKWYGHGEATVQLLLDHGAQISAIDDDGNSVLHLAFSKNEYHLAELLLQNGADLAARNKAGKIPVDTGSCLNKEIFYFMA